VSTHPSGLDRKRSERGAAALEFALIVPVLLTLLMGTVTTGLVYSNHLTATNAVREAARYGAAADATVPATWASSVQTRVQQTYFGSTGSSPTDDEICVDLVTAAGVTLASNGGSACGTAPSAPSGMAAGSCAVRVWMAHPEQIQLVVTELDLTIGAQSVAYYGRVVGTSCTAK
jgi:Flp pilus assembly protein TadG